MHIAPIKQVLHIVYVIQIRNTEFLIAIRCIICVYNFDILWILYKFIRQYSFKSLKIPWQRIFAQGQPFVSIVLWLAASPPGGTQENF
jgi:hypothetical protein